MVNRLPVWLFLSVALLLIGAALLPGLRVVLGIDQNMGLQFFTVLALLIGGIMSGLSAMILMVRRQAKIDWSQRASDNQEHDSKKNLVKLHACGLLLFSGIPLLNFLASYWLWRKHRLNSERMDVEGQEVLNFQITIYLYLLLSLIMAIAVIGVITTPLLLLFHLLITLWAIVSAFKDKPYKYPLNIPIIQGRPSSIGS